MDGTAVTDPLFGDIWFHEGGFDLYQRLGAHLCVPDGYVKALYGANDGERFAEAEGGGGFRKWFTCGSWSVYKGQ